MSTCATYVPPVAARTGVTPYRGAATAVAVGGAPVVALYGPLLSGIVQNPATTAEQGIAPLEQTTARVRPRVRGSLNTAPFNFRVDLNARRVATDTETVVTYGPPEVLYVSLFGPAALRENGITRALLPGQSLAIPPNWGASVWVNARTSGHRFAAVAVQPATAFPPVPYAGAFPPPGPTGKTATIPAYLYQQYSDDDDLQALFAAHNLQAQAYLEWFNALRLPDYTAQEGALLDWVLTGLYDLPRPTLYSGRSRNVGPYNTARLNDRAARLNRFAVVRTYADVAVTSDDVYKRVAAWHLYRGDGRHPSATWLRRRVARFLYGRYNDAGDTSQVSVLVSGGVLAITIVAGRRAVTGGPFNTAPFNALRYNALRTRLTTTAVPALAAIFKEAVDTGALEMPQPFQVVVRIGIVGAVAGVTPFNPGFSPKPANVLLGSDVLDAYLTTDDGSAFLTEEG